MPLAKHGLGRGLGALIPPGVPTALAPGVREVEVSRITPNPRQPRHHIDLDALNDLALSIQEHGLIQPLIVTLAPEATDEAPRYQLIAGERRWSAAKIAGLQRVPVIVRGATPQEMLELALVENIQRSDLNPLEEASAYRSLIDDFGLTQEQVADKVGKDRTTVANALRLLKLPENVQRALGEGQITEGHARALLTVPDLKQQEVLLKAIVENGLSVRQTEEAARRLNEKRRIPQAARVDTLRLIRPEPELPIASRAVEEELRKALGTRVQVVRSGEGGKIILHFYSEEELEWLFQRLVKK